MRNVQTLTECLSSDLCAKCGMPPDARYFDHSSITRRPDIGSEVVLARYELPSEYCGVLEYFSQWTDKWAINPHRVETPKIEWLILVNRRPLDPYLPWRHISNPWGYGSFPIALRLDESVTLEFVARGVHPRLHAPEVPEPERIGGRLVGRYWYNADFGDVVHRGK
jgi:hypothetical protein